MANTLKILGQAKSSGSYATAYIVPASTSAAVSGIVVCNTTIEKLVFSLYVVKSANLPDEYSLIYNNKEVLACDTTILSAGPTMAAGDYVSIKAPVGVSINVFGIEVT